MQECISISKIKTSVFSLFSAAAVVLSLAGSVWAQSAGPAPSDPGNDEILSGPFSDFGEFDSGDDEASDERFFQFGRFFGLGLETGFTTATGNAGKIYQGGFPTVGGKLTYWFDFNFALQVNLQNSKHNYEIGEETSDTTLFRTLFQMKYYLDTRDLSAAITFVGPHLIAGGGYYQRTDNIGSRSATASAANVTESYNAFGFNAGAGLELTLKPKSTYLQIEGLMHFVEFSDANSQRYSSENIADKRGSWITTSIGLMWTW